MEVKERSAKYLAKPACKQTEVGTIPEDWEVVALGEIGRFKNGLNKDSTSFGHGSPFVNLMDVFGVNAISGCENLGLVASTSIEQSAYGLKKGDVIFVRSSVKPSGVGLTAVVENDMQKTTYSGFLIRFRDNNYVNFDYKKHCFYSARFRSSVISGSSVSANTNISQETLKKLVIPLPPTHAEQQSIAEALSDADALIESLEQLLAKKLQIKQGAIQELLTGQKRLPGFAKTWGPGALNDVVDSLVAGVSVNSDETEPITGTPCVLKTSALSGGRFLPSECKSIARVDWRRAQTSPRKNSILISRMNTPDLVGEVGYVADDHPWLFLPDRIWMTQLRTNAHTNVQWLCYMLSSPAYRRQIKDSATGTSGSMKNISKDALLSLPILFPTEEEQTAIATLLSDMDAEIAALDAKLAKARDLKQGMMQELLTGRIRLV